MRGGTQSAGRSFAGPGSSAESAVRDQPKVSRDSWYVVATQRHRESVASVFLRQRGVPTYLPVMEQWPPPAVGSPVGPMFPGYLFVRLSLMNSSHLVLRTNGVKAFVCFGGGPVPVSDDVIEFLRTREAPDGVIRCGAASDGAREVRIVNGPFRGWTAVLEKRLPARQRVTVLLNLLQRDMSVELPERWVRRV